MFVFALLLSALVASDATVLLEQARTAFGQNRLTDAKSAATAALRQNPKLGDAEMILGLIATSGNDLTSALGHFSRAATLQPTNPRARGYLASTFMTQQRLTEAAREFNAVLKLDPANIAAQYNLGVIAAMEKKPEQAIRHFESVIRARPADVAALGGLLQMQLTLKRTGDARLTAAALQRSLPAGDPRLLEASALLVASGDYAGAVPLLETMHRSHPQSAEIAYNLALAQFRVGEADRAISTLAPFGQNAQALNLLGAIQESRREFPLAMQALRKAAQLDRSNENYRVDYASILMRHPDADAAVQEFATCARDFPKSFRVQVGLGSAYYLAGKYAEAANTLLGALALNDATSITYRLLARVTKPLRTVRNTSEMPFFGTSSHKRRIRNFTLTTPACSQIMPWARHYLNKALALNPQLAEAHLQLGVLEQSEGHLQQAITSLARAVDLAPDLAQARYRFATALAKAGDLDRSKAEMQQFQRLRTKERKREQDLVVRALAAPSRP